MIPKSKIISVTRSQEDQNNENIHKQNRQKELCRNMIRGTYELQRVWRRKSGERGGKVRKQKLIRLCTAKQGTTRKNKKHMNCRCKIKSTKTVIFEQTCLPFLQIKYELQNTEGSECGWVTQGVCFLMQTP
jgi:hypothetical protein